MQTKSVSLPRDIIPGLSTLLPVKLQYLNLGQLYDNTWITSSFIVEQYVMNSCSNLGSFINKAFKTTKQLL